MAAEQPKLVGQFVGLGGHHATVAGAAQVFGRIEAEAADRANRTDAASAELRSDRLRGVLDHSDSRLGRRGAKQVHLGRLPKQVDRQNGLGVRCNEPSDRRRIDIEAHRVDIGEDGHRAQPRNRRSRGEEREAG